MTHAALCFEKGFLIRFHKESKVQIKQQQKRFGTDIASPFHTFQATSENYSADQPETRKSTQAARCTLMVFHLWIMPKRPGIMNITRPKRGRKMLTRLIPTCWEKGMRWHKDLCLLFKGC